MMWYAIKRWRWALVSGALLLAGLVVAFWPEATPVDVGKVTRGRMALGVTDDGVTRAEDYYVVTAPVTGYLRRLELEAGDSIERGKLITTMTGRPSTPLDLRSSQELRSALDGARAGERAAAASLGQAQRDLGRAEELARRGFLPRAQLEAARTRAAVGAASLQQSRAEIRRLRAALTQPTGAGGGMSVQVRSPAGGSVLSVINESEGVITEGTPLVTIGDPHRIEAVVDLLSREAVRVRAGDRVEVTEWGGAAPLVGTVKRVEPFGRLKVSALGIEEQRVNVIIGFAQADTDKIARLGHGYQIDATIILWSTNDGLRVPIGALFRGGDGTWRVFVAEGGRARQRKLTVGQINDEYGEVLSGLSEGDVVVLNPSNSLKDGARISAR
ncbi:MAG TPA: efflux RND transporter periplasmic adaptor subunit [Terriglobales bacterium]|nr:efflux RND transporter periplasmic adaptor subunit [Terriglobales bacterium]